MHDLHQKNQKNYHDDSVSPFAMMIEVSSKNFDSLAIQSKQSFCSNYNGFACILSKKGYHINLDVEILLQNELPIHLQ